ncbi:hypothetical protein Tco_0364677 [Tanacetum coccineum]
MKLALLCLLKVDKKWKEKLFNQANNVRLEEPKKARENTDAPIIEDWVSDDEEEVESIPKEEKKANVPIATERVSKTCKSTVETSISSKSSLNEDWPKTVKNAKPFNTVRSVNTARPFSNARFVNTDFKEFDGGFVILVVGANEEESLDKGFQWVFFLRTKDETSGSLILYQGNRKNLQVRYRRFKLSEVTMGTEFKNKVMDELVEKKGTFSTVFCRYARRFLSLNISSLEIKIVFSLQSGRMTSYFEGCYTSICDECYKLQDKMGIMYDCSFRDDGINDHQVNTASPQLITWAMHEELLMFKLQNVWVLVDLPKGHWAIGTKWVYRNKKDERGIVVRKQGKTVAVPKHTQKKGLFCMSIAQSSNTDVKSASTPTDLERPLVKDSDADDVDEHLYRSMIGSLMYLTAS